MTGNTDLREVNGSVVVIGNFNPLIFQPEWLATHDVVGRKEAEAARQQADESRAAGIEVIHAQLSVLNLSALRLEVQLNRFSIMAREAPIVVARDFALKCFNLLSHTPVVQVGLNFGTVFRPRSRAAWDAFGDALAPKEPWMPLIGEIGKVRIGGLTNMRMELSNRNDSYTGQQSVQVGIIDRVTMDTLIEFNDHYELQGKSSTDRMAMLLDILEGRWETAEKQASTIADSLRSLCRAN